MSSIRIVSTPPGFAPEEIRMCWVDVVIPLATEEDIRKDPPSGWKLGNENSDGHLVLRCNAIQALRRRGQNVAAAYWQELGIGRYLLFKRDVCEVID